MITKPGGYESSATERMESARAVRSETIAREMCWVSIASRFWPSYVMLPRVPQKNFPLVVVLESPAGVLVYRVREDERVLFEHLEQRENDGRVSDDKIAVLLALATS